MRLNRFLSLCGLGSRRGCEEIIVEGRVAINDKQVKDLATVVAETDKVSVDGRHVAPKRAVVIALNKPKGYLCTKDDPQGRPTIYDLLPAKYQSLHHVGRLDQDSEGLILLTNDGELSQRLAHPSEGVEKEYEVRTEKKFDTAKLPALINGLNTKEGFARAERAWLEGAWNLHLILKQGLKRQIREMLYMLGYEVERLVRIRIGGLWLKGITKGKSRELTKDEVHDYFEKRAARPRKIGKPGVKSFSAGSGDDHFAPKKPAKAEKPVAEKPRINRGFEREDVERGGPPEPKSKRKAPSPKPTVQKHRAATGSGQRSRFTKQRFGNKSGGRSR